MRKLFIIEDDKWISSSLKLYLENSDFKVFLYESWDKATEKILEKDVDLVILDINLPVKSWIEICKELRGKSMVPIVMLTAKTWELDKIKWFETWADDYIPKPFSPRELLVRINSILRRANNKTGAIQDNSKLLKFKNIKLDLEKVILFVDEKKVSTTKNEFEILKKIIEEDWKMVTRETIMTKVMWYEKYVYDRTIDTHIKNLRKKIWEKDIILTIRWEWYRLNK